MKSGLWRNRRSIRSRRWAMSWICWSE